MVELRMRKREMRGDGGNHQERLGHKRISCASQFTMPNMAGMSPDPTCNFTDTRSSQHHQASRTPDFSYKLVSSTSFSLSSPSLSFSSTTLPLLQHTKLSHLSLSLHVMIMSLHRVQHIPSTSIHRVQAYTEYKHTPSTSIHRVQAYTEYSIHRLQHRPEIVCLPFILMITSWPLNVASASGVPPYRIDRHQPGLHESWMG